MLWAAELGVNTQLAEVCAVFRTLCLVLFVETEGEKHDKSLGGKHQIIYPLERLAPLSILKCITLAETKLSAVTNLIFDVV